MQSRKNQKSSLITNKLTWLKKKPFIKDLKPCIIITKQKYKNSDAKDDYYYEYDIYEIKKIVFEDKWYWGICDKDGNELGDYKGDFNPTELAIIEI